MAHILQNDDMATEIYLCDGEIADSKFLLIVRADGRLELKWCYGDFIETQINPLFVKIGKKMMLEYGEPNLFMQRQKLTFQGEDGKLDEIWEKVM